MAFGLHPDQICEQVLVGFARGIPSNFVGKVLIWDTKTRKLAKAAFDTWYANRCSVPASKPKQATEAKPAVNA